MRFTHKRCSYLNSVPHGSPRQGQVARCSLQWCLLPLSLSQQKQDVGTHVASPTAQITGLSCGQQNSAQNSSPLSLGSAPLRLTWAQLGFVFPHRLVPMAAPALWHKKAPLGSAEIGAWSCVLPKVQEAMAVVGERQNLQCWSCQLLQDRHGTKWCCFQGAFTF